jgi:sigma-E factor negative regulatory protein RseC
MSGQLIEHEGVIEQIEDEIAHVKISSQSACSACHAKGVCGAADQEEKYLDIPVTGSTFARGETVMVQVARNLGLRAVALGYIYPFLLVMIILIALIISGMDELKAGTISLCSLLPYYLVLFLTRKRIESNFTFSIRKTQIVP